MIIHTIARIIENDIFIVMDDKQVQFEENYYDKSHINSPDKSGLTDIIIKKSGGLIENEDQAIKVLGFIGIVTFILAIVIFYISVRGPSVPSPNKIVPVAGPSDPNNFNF